jgi:hypothetical protein
MDWVSCAGDINLPHNPPPTKKSSTIKSINNRISFKHLYHSYLSAFIISAGVPNGEFSEILIAKCRSKTVVQTGVGQPLMQRKTSYFDQTCNEFISD